MSVEIPHPDAEQLWLARNALVEYAAGSLSLHEAGLTDPLRLYQVDAMRKTLEFITSPDSLVPDSQNLPPTRLARLEETMGWGKSPVQAILAKNLGFGQMINGNTPALPEGTQALQLVPTRYLKDQMRDDYAQFAPGLVEGGHVRIATYQYMWRAVQRGEFKPGQFPLILSDEAHRSLGELTLRMLQQQQEHAYDIGSSGTPNGNEKYSVASTLPYLIDRTTMRDGILNPDKDYRFLSGIRVFTLYSGESVLDVGKQRGNEYPEEAVRHLAASPERNQAIIDAALHGMLHTGGKGLIKCVQGNNQLHAQTIAGLLQEKYYPGTHRHINAQAIGSFNPKTRKIIQQFKETDDIDVLVYVKAINEGLNIPELAWGVWGMDTASRTDLAQGMARGLRPSKLPFFFYQITDEVPKRFKQPVMAWSILGETKDPGPTFQLAGPDTALPYVKPPKTRVRAKQPHSYAVITSETSGVADDAIYEYPIFFADALAPDDIEETHHAIKKLVDWTGIPAERLENLLAKHGRRPANLTLVDNKIEQFYPADSEEFLLNNVALPGDLDIRDSAAELGITELALRKRLQRLNDVLQPIPLFPRVNQHRDTRIAHLTPVQRKLIAERYNREYDPDEHPGLPIGEAARMLERTFSATQVMLARRGFETTSITSPKNPDDTVMAYQRSEVAAWINAFNNAADRPKTGFTPLATVVRTTKVLYSDACKAARAADIHLPLFKTAKTPAEFVADDDHEALLTAIHKYIGETRNDQGHLITKHPTVAETKSSTDQEPAETAPSERFSEVQLIRDSLRIPRLAGYTIRPHVTTNEIARKLRAYNLKGEDVAQYAAQKSYAVTEVDNATFVETREADNLIDSYIAEHGMPSKVMEDSAAVAKRLRCSKSVIKYLAKNVNDIHTELRKSKEYSVRGDLHVEYDNGEVSLSTNAISAIATFLGAAGPVPRSAVFLGANILNYADEFNPRLTLPAALRKEMQVHVLKVPDGKYLQMIYGTPQIAHYHRSSKPKN
jgi:superfamily II DNA or RNA helicase